MPQNHNGLNTIVTRLLEMAIDLSRYQEGLPAPACALLDARSADDPVDGAGAGLAAIAKRLLKEADDREKFFAGFVSPDPVWPILLDLYIHTAERRNVSVSSACVAARVPSSTAQRWICDLVERGVIVRTPDPKDGRRSYLTLSADVFINMSRYLAGIAGIEPLLGAATTLNERAQC